MIGGVLNDARRTQTALSACQHDSLVEERIRRPMKPNEGCIAEVAQPEPRSSGYGVTLGRSEHDLVPRYQQPSEIPGGLCQAEDESGIQPARLNGFGLLDR